MNEIAPAAPLLARKALDWLLLMARGCGNGLAWTRRPDDDELDPTLYSGAAGIVLALLEGYQHFGGDRYGEAAELRARSIAAAADEGWELSSLYLGLAGLAFALREVHRLLGDRSADQAAARSLDLLRSRFDGERWSGQFELLGGNAGIALGAARAGDLDLAVMPADHYSDVITRILTGLLGPASAEPGSGAVSR